MNKLNLNKSLMINLILIIITILLAGCNKPRTSIVFSGLYFDTFITVTIFDPFTDEQKNELNNLCQKYDLLFSTENTDSELYKLNNSNGNEFIASDELIYVLNEALYYSEMSNGKLDPTIETVCELWDFKQNPTDANNKIPNANEISSAQSLVNYKNIQIDKNSITIPKNTKINLGYMAKGYIADKIKEYLDANNINNYIINLGGNILLSGAKQDNSLYNIGIEKPFSNGEAIYTINTTDTSIVTSGIYERYFEYDDKIYHHIMDVNTGYPVENNLYSVTITGPSSTKCDALSTLVFILGEDEGLKFINDLEGYEALFVLSDYSLIKSDNFK